MFDSWTSYNTLNTLSWKQFDLVFAIATETLVYHYTRWYNNQSERYLYLHRRDNLKSYIISSSFIQIALHPFCTKSFDSDPNHRQRLVTLNMAIAKDAHEWIIILRSICPSLIYFLQPLCPAPPTERERPIY